MCPCASCLPVDADCGVPDRLPTAVKTTTSCLTLPYAIPCLRSLQGDFDLSLAADGMIAAALFVGLMLSAPAAAQLSKQFPALRLVGAGLL